MKSIPRSAVDYCPQTKDNLRQKTLLSSFLGLLFGEGKARSQEKRDGLRRNSQYSPTVEDIPRMLTMCTKRIWKSETKGYSSTFWRKRLYFEKILKRFWNRSQEKRDGLIWNSRYPLPVEGIPLLYWQLPTLLEQQSHFFIPPNFTPSTVTSSSPFIIASCETPLQAQDTSLLVQSSTEYW